MKGSRIRMNQLFPALDKVIKVSLCNRKKSLQTLKIQLFRKLIILFHVPQKVR